MGHRKKVCLCMLMGLGLFAAIAAIIKTSKLPELNVEDFTWVSFELYSWAIVEIFILVVCGCIPTLGPLYSQWLGSKTLQYYRTLTLHAQGPQSDNPAQRVAMGKIGHPSIIRGRKDRSLWLSTGSYEDLSTGDTRVPSPRETSIALSADGDSRQDNEIMREHSIV
ncbi:hypothetical protein MMC19_006658 [Ptychographa xylographoides]|nr:hypothetical protein [Ptychographa xylographoides]